MPRRKGNIALVILVVVTCGFLGAFFYVLGVVFNLSVSSSMSNASSIDELLFGSDKKEVKLSGSFPPAYFSKITSNFLMKERKPSEITDPLSTEINLPDPSVRPLCEANEGTWFETKGKDLPVANCTCPYNDWRKKNLENVVSSGCDCSVNCLPRASEFPQFDFVRISRLAKPKVDLIPGSGKHLIFRDDLSSCSYLAVKDNVCKPCQIDNDCGTDVNSSSTYWLHEKDIPVCDAGMCRFRRIIYAEY